MRNKDLKDTELRKPEICAKIAERTDIPLRAVNRIFDTFADVIIEEVAQGKTVHFTRVGKFYARYFKGGRKMKHPATGEPFVIEGNWRPCFRLSEPFRRTVKRLRGTFDER